ncbi:hypothetical protein [Pseudaestuariivita atlantica]|uniref:DUF3726 domain-containing protein n=1 Tax=Pseudaestuariivita atlantica TaxID=1317121 RepID=A0A0L1JQT7_9RHOB|nr:hypothetical protein [Pseudaestuariivita atlantica]KNG94101.1 hypothetical protein ATO11_07610 [Pseudaestuariivita atlantica]
MSFSLNEVAALGTKAARGAGADPAVAAAFGAALVRHLCAGRAAEDIDGALDALPHGPALHGALICRLMRRYRETQGTVSAPAHVPQALARSYLDTLPAPPTATFRAVEEGEVRYELPPLDPAPLPDRIEVPTALLTRLNRLAKETYVPNSDASRAAGAGAGLTDND